MPDMTGRPGCRTMEMFGGSTASYLARTPRIPLFVFIFIGLETKNVLDYQGRAGSTSIVQWTLRPVIFGVEVNPQYDVAAARRANNILAETVVVHNLVVLQISGDVAFVCVTVQLPVRPRGETTHWPAKANTPLSLTPLLNPPENILVRISVRNQVSNGNSY